EDGDDAGDVVRRLRAADWYLSDALAEVLARRQIEQPLPGFAVDLRPHVRLDDARADRVDADPAGRVAYCQAAREVDHRRLARAVVDVRRRRVLPAHRGDIDDPAGVLGDHRRQHRLAAEEHRLGIDREDGVPLRFRDLLWPGDAHDAGVVDED